jgi:hypothetical protein
VSLACSGAAYSVAPFDEIDEIDDGGAAYRPVRQHFGIASFGVSSFTGRNSGDRIINEHSEEDDQEELYVVLQGRATFELDGERGSDALGAFFCLACCEARAGRAEDAARHLRHALERSERLRGLASRNADLDSIRHRREIAELLAG